MRLHRTCTSCYVWGGILTGVGVGLLAAFFPANADYTSCKASLEDSDGADSCSNLAPVLLGVVGTVSTLGGIIAFIRGAGSSTGADVVAQ